MTHSSITRRHAIVLTGTLFALGCSPDNTNQTGPSPRSSDKASAGAVADSWRRVHAWLAANAPKIIGNLNPPAMEAEIREAEEVFACQMPEDWRALYRVHNGMNSTSNLGCLFYGMDFINLTQLIHDHREYKMKPPTPSFKTPAKAADSGIRPDDLFNEKWFTLGHDWGEIVMYIDMDPAPSGTLGQVIVRDVDDDTVVFLHKSVADLMSTFASDLEVGRYSLDKEALAEGDHFLACDPEVDVLNWRRSPRWKHMAK